MPVLRMSLGVRLLSMPRRELHRAANYPCDVSIREYRARFGSALAPRKTPVFSAFVAPSLNLGVSRMRSFWFGQLLMVLTCCMSLSPVAAHAALYYYSGDTDSVDGLANVNDGAY